MKASVSLAWEDDVAAVNLIPVFGKWNIILQKINIVF